MITHNVYIVPATGGVAQKQEVMFPEDYSELRRQLREARNLIQAYTNEAREAHCYKHETEQQREEFAKLFANELSFLKRADGMEK
ncbi:MAG: hypothetical protein PQJ59_01740 [Spirochaetales bacterium]|nr:hypothetical protein [Spirochaetales bacterium]